MTRRLCILREFFGLVGRQALDGRGRIGVRTAWHVAVHYHTDRPRRQAVRP